MRRRYYILIIALLAIQHFSIAQSRSCKQEDLCYGKKKFDSNFKIELEIEKKLQRKQGIWQTVFVQDLDDDCIPELISIGEIESRVLDYYGHDVVISNSVTGLVSNIIYTAYFNTGGNCIVVLKDGSSYVVIVACADWTINPESTRGRLVCYYPNGRVKWISDTKFINRRSQGYIVNSLSTADFNGDGIPEVYIGTEIFNAQTGKRLLNRNYGGSNSGFVGVAANMDDDPSDLELVSGYTIYKVVLNNLDGTAGNEFIPYNMEIDGNRIEGNLMVADINGDGKLDAVVVSERGYRPGIIYAYTLKDEKCELIAKREFPNYLSTKVIGGIGNFSNKDDLGIAVFLRDSLKMLSYDGSELFSEDWSFGIDDNYASFPLSAFDFDNDGVHEIVYRDWTRLVILSAKDNQPNIIASQPCLSGTIYEFPVIADIYNDGSSRICVSCLLSQGSLESRVNIFGPPKGQKWAPARNIWHQYAYNPLLINDDGTLPQQMHNIATYKNGKYNNFNVQESLLDEGGYYDVPAPSLLGEITCINYNETTDSYTVHFVVKNRQDASETVDAGIPVAFYTGNPEQDGQLIGVYHTTSGISAGNQTDILTYTFSASNISSLWMVVNTDNYPLMLNEISNYFSPECDYTDNLFIYPLPEVQRSVKEICGGETIDFFGQTLMESGNYIVKKNSISGCDSLISILDLIVTDIKTETIVDTACDHFVWNGETYDKSGDYEYITQSLSGCDSIVTLSLSVHPSLQNTINHITCDLYDWNGKTYTDSGNYLYTGQTAAGCDSLVTLALTIHSSVTNTIGKAVCDSYEWNGEIYEQSGIYTYNGQTYYGCDSIVILDLKVSSAVTESVIETACDNFTWNGETYDRSGTYEYFTQSISGCDSIVTLSLSVHPSLHNTINLTTCDSYDWNGETYTKSGNYFYNGQTAAGCDSMVALALTIHASAINIIERIVCDSYEWNGQRYDQSGTYTYNGQTKYGCDSTAILELVVSTSLTVTEEKTACDQIIINGIKLDTSGDYPASYLTSTGCDSTHILRLTINQSTQSNQAITACSQYDFFGSTITVSGIYRHTLTNQQGCDSLITLDLHIAAEMAHTSASACGSYHWAVGDTTITNSGVYTARYFNQYGCDSTITLSLNIAPEYDIQKQEEACGNYTWQVTKERYTATGIYSQLLKTVQGCDSLITLDLTVHPEFEFHDTVSTTSPYYWPLNGQTYDQSGVYTELFRSDASCDSLHVLHLRVNYNTDIYFPNVITGEGRNGFFTGYSTGEGIQIKTLSVFDRWGNRVFHKEHFAANEPEAGWNGKFGGRDVVQGVYIWTAQIVHRDGREETFSGDVTVVR